jgi:hypothetical protein
MMNGSLQAEMQCDEAEGGERGEWQRKQAALAVCDGPTAPPPALSLSGVKDCIALRCVALPRLRCDCWPFCAALRLLAMLAMRCDSWPNNRKQPRCVRLCATLSVSTVAVHPSPAESSHLLSSFPTAALRSSSALLLSTCLFACRLWSPLARRS